MKNLYPPRVTIYSRALDNITNQELEGFSLLNKKSNLNFGKINGITGGESSIVIEFDIWNNESAIMGGFSVPAVSDAINCRFTAWDDTTLRSSRKIEDENTYKPYIYARSMSKGYDDFQPIAGSRYLPSEKIYSNFSAEAGILSGRSGGDHFKVQTKIVIPNDTKFAHKNFVFEFTYDYV